MSNYALVHGDCLEKMRDIPDGCVNMAFCDLPYGVTRNKWDTVIPFEPLWMELLRVGKKNCVFIFTATQPFVTALINSQPNLFRYDLIWEKSFSTGFLNAKKCPLRIHEHCIFFYKKLPVYNPQKTAGTPYKVTQSTKVSPNYGHHVNKLCINVTGERLPTSIVRIVRDRKRDRGSHPTQKPVALLEWLVKTYTNEGDLVLDPTMGSGTTGVACINTGRHFIGIEKDDTYFKTASKRLADVKTQG